MPKFSALRAESRGVFIFTFFDFQKMLGGVLFLSEISRKVRGGFLLRGGVLILKSVVLTRVEQHAKQILMNERTIQWQWHCHVLDFKETHANSQLKLFCFQILQNLEVASILSLLKSISSMVNNIVGSDFLETEQVRLLENNWDNLSISENC